MVKYEPTGLLPECGVNKITRDVHATLSGTSVLDMRSITHLHFPMWPMSLLLLWHSPSILYLTHGGATITG